MNVTEKSSLFEEMSIEETDKVQGGIFTVIGPGGLQVLSIFPGLSTGFSLNLGPFGSVTF